MIEAQPPMVQSAREGFGMRYSSKKLSSISHRLLDWLPHALKLYEVHWWLSMRTPFSMKRTYSRTNSA